MRKFVIGCDNAAVELKEILKDFLLKNGAEVEDVGVAIARIQPIIPQLLKEPVASLQTAALKNAAF